MGYDQNNESIFNSLVDFLKDNKLDTNENFVAALNHMIKQNEVNIIEITTDNVNDGDYYFNFVEGSKNNASWHLSYENLDAGDGYYMPSFSLNSSIKLYIEKSLEFEEISTIPSNNLFSSSNGKLESGGEYEVLTYDMQVHKISVSDYNYIINETVSNKVFKIHFDDYSSGVVIFRYAELTSE